MTRRCVSKSSCPYGQDSSSGVCLSICDIGFYFYEGICIYGGCFNGYTPNAYGGCVRQSQSEVSANFGCNSGQYSFKGKCVGSCGDGYYPDAASNQCLACSSNCLSCFTSSYCIICSGSYQAINGACVQQTSCPSGQYSYNSACVSSCPLGTYGDGSKCNRICSDGTYYYNQVCFISCPTGLRTPAACVAQCPQGATSQGGVCI